MFHNKFCDAIFRCGCTWDWAGGWSRCNIHNVDGKSHAIALSHVRTGPHCPWCAAKEPWLLFTDTRFFLMFGYVVAWRANV